MGMISWKIWRRIILGIVAAGFLLLCIAGGWYMVFGRRDDKLEMLRQEELIVAQETEKVLAEVGLAEEETKQLELRVDELREERLRLEAEVKELEATGINRVWESIAQHLTRQSRALAGLQTVYLGITAVCVLGVIVVLGLVVSLRVLGLARQRGSDRSE